jgi:hypothetical protein
VLFREANNVSVCRRGVSLVFQVHNKLVLYQVEWCICHILFLLSDAILSNPGRIIFYLDGNVSWISPASSVEYWLVHWKHARPPPTKFFTVHCSKPSFWIDATCRLYFKKTLLNKVRIISGGCIRRLRLLKGKSCTKHFLSYNEIQATHTFLNAKTRRKYVL